MPDLVTVFGGAGFLGRHIVGCLKKAGFAVRVASRQVHEDLDAEFVTCDVRDSAAVSAALKGAAAAVNSVSLYVEKGEQTFEALHVQAAELVAREASARGLGTLIQISGINAGPDSLSVYAQARGRGDEAVQAAFPAAIVLRPSVIFGPGDRFFNLFADMAKVAPFLPLFGQGETRLQPVFVGDVAQAVVGAIEDPKHRGAVFELGGPKSYSYRELLRLTMNQVGRRRALLPVPFPFWDLAAALASVLPSPPLTRDQVALMRRHNVVDPSALGFADLGITPRSVEEILPNYL